MRPELVAFLIGFSIVALMWARPILKRSGVSISAVAGYLPKALPKGEGRLGKALQNGIIVALIYAAVTTFLSWKIPPAFEWWEKHELLWTVGVSLTAATFLVSWKPWIGILPAGVGSLLAVGFLIWRLFFAPMTITAPPSSTPWAQVPVIEVPVGTCISAQAADPIEEAQGLYEGLVDGRPYSGDPRTETFRRLQVRSKTDRPIVIEYSFRSMPCF